MERLSLRSVFLRSLIIGSLIGARVALAQSTFTSVQITGPQRVTAGVCSTAYAIKSKSIAPTGSTSIFPVTVNLSVSKSAALFLDSSCRTKIDKLTLTSLATSGKFYFKDSVLEEENIRASVSGQLVSTFKVTTTSPTRVAITGSTLLSAGSCSVQNLVLLDNDSFSLQASMPTDVAISATGSAKLYSDASCLTPVLRVTIPTGLSAKAFYVRDTSIESISINATPSAPLKPGSQLIKYVGGAPSSLKLSGPEMLVTGKCSKPFTLTAIDNVGNPALVKSLISAKIVGASPDNLYSDANCTRAVNSLTIFPGLNEVQFYAMSMAGQLHTLRASVASSATNSIPSGTTSSPIRYASCTPGVWKNRETGGIYEAGLGLHEPPVEATYGYETVSPDSQTVVMPECPYFTGDVKLPVLMVDWADFNPETDLSNPRNPDSIYTGYVKSTPQDADKFLNGEGSISEYFKDISGGWTRTTFDVVGWIRSDAPGSYLKPRSTYLYTLPGTDHVYCDREAVFRDALKSAIAFHGLDLRKYDADNNGLLDGAVLMYEGDAGLCTGTNLSLVQSGGIWLTSPPQFAFTDASTLVESSDPNYARFADQKIRFSVYNNIPESTIRGDRAFRAETWAHELGHMLWGYSDYYYPRFNMGSYALSSPGFYLTQPAAWEKWLFGRWISPTEVSASGTYSLMANEIPDRTNYTSGSYLLKIQLDNDPRKFITVENRWFLNAGNTGSRWAKADGQESGLTIVEFDLSADYFSDSPVQVYRSVPSRTISSGQYTGWAAYKLGDEYTKCSDTRCVSIKPLNDSVDKAEVSVTFTQR